MVEKSDRRRLVAVDLELTLCAVTQDHPQHHFVVLPSHLHGALLQIWLRDAFLPLDDGRKTYHVGSARSTRPNFWRPHRLDGPLDLLVEPIRILLAAERHQARAQRTSARCRRSRGVRRMIPSRIIILEEGGRLYRAVLCFQSCLL